jgi:hypothetical protein
MSDDTIKTIRQALAALDPADQQDWTEQGRPSMKAICSLVGADVTRRQVEAAAPGFTRDNPVIPGEPAAEPTGPTMGDDWAIKTPQDRARDAQPEQSLADLLRLKIADLGEAHRLLAADIKAAQVRDAQIVADIDAAQRELDALVPPETAAQKYARLMKRSDEERAAAMAAARKAQPVEVSPLDRRLGARRTRRFMQNGAVH